MFDAVGSTIAEEFVRIDPAEEKITSRLIPDAVVPKLVIVALPVTITDSPSDVPRSVVDAAAMDAEESALVERMIADRPRMKSSRLFPMASDPAGLLLAARVYKSDIFTGTAIMGFPC